ncbi:Cell death protease [Mortierella sp. AD094]|nr:Cell death protease [Mortierella sp. AD094]
MRATSLAWLAVAALGHFSFLTVVIRAQVADDYLVTNMPDLSPEDAAQLKQYAGHIALDIEKESHLFFWMVANKQSQESSKLVIWLNGGPGCSSADGYFLESGPLRFVDNKLTINKGGWHEFSNILFLDQPIGTGLSYSSKQLLGTLEEVTDNFLSFLKAFYAIFPERAKDDLYLAGESYAGTYIPYFAKGILDHNDQVPQGEIPYNLKGLAVGNGWIDPLTQYTSYIPFVVQHGLSSPDLMYRLISQQDHCLDDIRMQNRITQYNCEEIIQIILDDSSKGPTNTQCLNQYDVRLKDEYPYCGLLWPYELPDMKTYLSRDDVRKALHATGIAGEWNECNTRVGAALRFDDAQPSFALLPKVLEKVNLMLYRHNAPETFWTVDEKPAGVWRQERNLTYVLFYNASHMVPYDAPLAAADMMSRFMGLDPKKQAFTSRLGTDKDTTAEEDLPPGGEKVDIDQPQKPTSSTGSMILMIVMIAIGAAIFVIMRYNRRQRKLGRGDGVQWFPLSNSGSAGRGHEPIHTDELDELVVESGIRSDEDDDDDDEVVEEYHDGTFDSPDPYLQSPLEQRH